MKSFLVAVLFVGLLGLALGADSDLELLKRILAVLKEKKAVEKSADVNLERRNSYGIIWSGKDKELFIYLQKDKDCADPCKFEITFQNEDGKTIGNELFATFTRAESGRVSFTESEIMTSSFADGGDKDKAAGNGENEIGGERGDRLPAHLIVRVCRIEAKGVKACNKRPVDTSRDRDVVFFKTVKDNYNPKANPKA